MNDLSHDDLTALPRPELRELMARGLVDHDHRGRLFVTLKGECLRARSARDAMLMRLGIRPGPAPEVTIRTGPDTHLSVRINDEVPPDLQRHEARVQREARELAEARQRARLAGEVTAVEPAISKRHLKAV
jgi:hypothetical protein